MLVFGLLAALTLGSAPPAGSGHGEEIELRWSAPEGCPAADDVLSLVEQLVPITEARLRAVARIDVVPMGFDGTLELEAEGIGTTRRLQADDCMVLARAMAVVMAVSLDPVVVAAGAEAPAVPGPESVAPGPIIAESAREPEPARRLPIAAEPSVSTGSTRSEPRPPTARTGLEAGARLGAGIGGLLFPAAGVGLSLAPFVGTARVHVRAVAQYWAPQTVAFDPRRDARGELQLLTGGVRVCPQLAWARVRIPLCAGVDAGAMLGRGTGRDLTHPRSAREPWVGVVLEPGVTVGVTSRVSLWLALEGVVSVYRPRFAVDGAPRDWTAGAGALRGFFGVQVHWRRNRPQNA